MSQTIVINGRLPSLNEYIKAERTNRFIAAKVKKQTMEYIGWQINSAKAIQSPAIYTFHWYVKNARTDPDNIAFAVKFIFDALQEAGKLENDSFKNVLEIHHLFTVDKQERVELTIDNQSSLRYTVYVK